MALGFLEGALCVGKLASFAVYQSSSSFIHSFIQQKNCWSPLHVSSISVYLGFFIKLGELRICGQNTLGNTWTR